MTETPDPIQQKLSALWRVLAGIDLRTLALFRIGLAVTLLADISTFWPSLQFFLGDDGIFPRQLPVSSGNAVFSLFFMTGRPELLHALFLLGTLCAILFLFGYRTRLMAVLCWVFLVSLNGRTSPFLSGADVQLAVMWFWALFLPLGARFSVDAALAKNPPAQGFVATIASLALLLQVTYVYLIGALRKTGDAWMLDHTAVQMAVSNVHLATPISAWLAQMPELSRWLTIYVYNLEIYAVFFLFMPVFNARFRLLMVALLGTMHIGFYLFLKVSFFPLVSLVGVSAFLPALFWDALKERRMRSKALDSATIYYDAPCGFCYKVCRIFVELSALSRTRILTAQSDPQMATILEREQSWIVRTPSGALLTKWEAVSWVWRRSPLLWPLGLVFLPRLMRPLGEKIYAQIAAHRPQLARLSARLLPEAQEVSLRPSMAALFVVSAMIFVALFFNVRLVERWRNMPMPESFSTMISYANLWQRWSMFAPHPSDSSRWGVIEGELEDGRKVDLLFERDEPPRISRPERGSEAFPSRRWHKFFFGFKWRGAGTAVGRAFCTRWQESGKKPALKKVSVWMYSQKNPLNQSPMESDVQKRVLLEHTCELKRARPTAGPPRPQGDRRDTPSSNEEVIKDEELPEEQN